MTKNEANEVHLELRLAGWYCILNPFRDDDPDGWSVYAWQSDDLDHEMYEITVRNWRGQIALEALK